MAISGGNIQLATVINVIWRWHGASAGGSVKRKAGWQSMASGSLLMSGKPIIRK